MTTRDTEALGRCPLCAELTWQCDHEILRYFAPEGDIGETPLARDIRDAARELHDLFESCLSRSVAPVDATLAAAFRNQLSERIEEGAWSYLITPVVDYLQSLQWVRRTEDRDSLVLWSRNLDDIREALLQWKSRIGAEAARLPDSVDTTESESTHAACVPVVEAVHLSDREWIGILAHFLPSDRGAEILRQLVTALVPVAVQGLGVESADPDTLAPAYVRERLGRSPSVGHAAELIGMACDNDLNFLEWIFADDQAELLLVSDEELARSGVTLLERYLDYRDNYPERELIHPSDYTGSVEDDEQEERQRIASDFVDLARSWRDQFLKQLIMDVEKAKRTDS